MEVAICDEGGDDTAWDGADVEEDEHPEFEVHAVVGGELLDEEVRDVLADETEEGGEVHDFEGKVFKDGGVEDLASAGGFGAGLDDDAGDDEGEDGDEADDADGPAEADGGLDVGEDDGVDDTAERGAGGGDTHGESAFLAEVGGKDGGCGDEKGAAADTAADALGEHELPVFLAERGHHDAEDNGEGAKEDEESRGADVKDGTP